MPIDIRQDAAAAPFGAERYVNKLRVAELDVARHLQKQTKIFI